MSSGQRCCASSNHRVTPTRHIFPLHGQGQESGTTLPRERTVLWVHWVNNQLACGSRQSGQSCEQFGRELPALAVCGSPGSKERDTGSRSPQLQHRVCPAVGLPALLTESFSSQTASPCASLSLGLARLSQSLHMAQRIP